MAIRWGLSILDCRSHAINVRVDHPIGVYRAQCGHVLVMVTELFDRPNGALCLMCGNRRPRPPLAVTSKNAREVERVNHRAPLCVTHLANFHTLR